MSKIDLHSHSRQRTFLLSDKGIQLSTAKAFVFVEWRRNPIIDRQSLRVLRFSKNVRIPESHRRMERENWVDHSQPSISRIRSSWRRANAIRVAKFPRIHNMADFRWDSEDDGRDAMWTWAVHRSNHSHCNDIVWWSNENTTQKCVLQIPWMWHKMQKDSRTDTGHSSDLDQKRNGTGQICTNRAQNGTMSMNEWRLTSVKSGHPEFRGTSPSERWTLRSTRGGKLSTHFCGDPETVEVVFPTIISVNLLSIYGAVADICV